MHLEGFLCTQEARVALRPISTVPLAYDYRARLAYVMTFDHRHARTIFTCEIHNVACECRGSV